MSEARIGRLAAAALHESLAIHLPFRVEFYEHWLQPPRLRSGSVGLASFLAVVSFLRQEAGMYDTIVRDAGRHAADWVFADVSVLTRLRWRWLPGTRRLRAAMRLVQRLNAEASPVTHCRITWQRRVGRMEIEESVFCHVRTAVATPLCGFYAAALARFCHHLDVPAHVRHDACRAMGDPCCAIALTSARHGAGASEAEPSAPPS